MSRYRTLLPALLAVGLLTGCGGISGGNAVPPPPDWSPTRIGADRQAPASGIAGDRERSRHDADGAALDEARDQPIGSIVPRDSQKQAPPPPSASQL